MTKAFGWQRCIAAHSFNGFLHADRHSACGRSLDLIAVQQATKPFLRAAGSVVPGILTLVLRVLLLPGTPRICWRHHVLVVCRT